MNVGKPRAAVAAEHCWRKWRREEGAAGGMPSHNVAVKSLLRFSLKGARLPGLIVGTWYLTCSVAEGFKTTLLNILEGDRIKILALARCLESLLS
jgi:hypothetical protein